MQLHGGTGHDCNGGLDVSSQQDHLPLGVCSVLGSRGEALLGGCWGGRCDGGSCAWPIHTGTRAKDGDCECVSSLIIERAEIACSAAGNEGN